MMQQRSTTHQSRTLPHAREQKLLPFAKAASVDPGGSGPHGPSKALGPSVAIAKPEPVRHHIHPVTATAGFNPPCPCGGICPRCSSASRIQPKLLIDGPGDRFEQEADRIAEEIVGRSFPNIPDSNPPIAMATSPGGDGGAMPLIVAAALSSPGRPLATDIRAFFEPRFARDLRRIRIHTDSSAAESAAAIRARAYTIGSDIVFGAGEFSPETSAGRLLLAHEIAHATQQGATGPVTDRGDRPPAPSILHEPPRALRRRTTAEGEAAVAEDAPTREQIVAIANLLRSGVRDQEVSDVLIILRSWGSIELVTNAWSQMDDRLLVRFLKNLEVSHFAGYPLEIVASIAALDTEARNRMIRQTTLGPFETTSPAEAARALFLIMDLEIGPETEQQPARRELSELLGVENPDPDELDDRTHREEARAYRRQTRAHREEARIAERIRSALPGEVRLAIVEAIDQREAGIPPRDVFPDRTAKLSHLASEPIIAVLTRGRISSRDSREAFNEFALLLENNESDVLTGTVQRLEQEQVLSPWLEHLVRDSKIDMIEEANAGVLEAILAQRAPAFALSHIHQLLRAGRRNQTIPPEDSFLARRIAEAQPPEIEEALRLELATHPDGDLTARFAPLTGAEEALIIGASFDDWLAAYRHAVLEKRWDSFDLLDVLYVRPGEEFMASETDFPLQPVNRASLVEDLAALDRLGVFDALLAQIADEEATPSRPALVAVIPQRSAAANISSVRRLVRDVTTESRAVLAFEIQLLMPAADRERLVADEELWAKLTEALPASYVGGSTFGPIVKLDPSQLAGFLTQLDDPSLWLPNGDGGLSPTLDVMLTLAIQAGLGPAVAQIVEEHLDAADSKHAAGLASALEAKGFARVDAKAPVRFEEISVIADSERDITGVSGLNRILAAITGGAVIEADNLADWLSQGRGMFLNVAAPAENAKSGAPNTFTVKAAIFKGVFQATSSALDLTSANAIFDGAVVRTGSGRIENLALWYKWTERNPQPLRVSAEALDLRNITITTETGVYGVGHLRVEGLALDADLTTGRQITMIFSRISGLADLLFAIFDALFTIVELVRQSVLPSDEGPQGFAAMASSIVTRFESRIAVHGNVQSVFLEGLVAPGLGSLDTLTIKSDEERAVNAVAFSLTSNIDWNRLSQLRELWSKGKIMEDEQDELAELERKALCLALGLEVAPLEATGARTVVLGENNLPIVRAALEQVTFERLSIAALLDSVKRGVEIPTEQGGIGTTTPLSALAALDDGIYEARVLTLRGIVARPSVTLAFEQMGSPELFSKGGVLDFENGEMFILPDGSPYFVVSDVLLSDLLLRARAFPSELNIQELKAGRGTAQRLGSEIGALAGAEPSFPPGKEGDWVATLEDIMVGSVDLTIPNLMALSSDSGSTCKVPEILELLGGLSGKLTFKLDVSVPIETQTRLGTVTLEGSPVVIEVTITNGIVAFAVTSFGGAWVEAALRTALADDTLTMPLSGIAGALFEKFVCTPDESKADSGSTSTWSDWLDRQAARAASRVESIVKKLLGFGGKFTEISIESRVLRWRMGEINLTQWKTHLDLDWGSGNGIPIDLQLHVVPAPDAPGRMDLTIKPFSLSRAVGQVSAVPVLVDGLTLGNDFPISIDFGGFERITLSASLTGLAVNELRLLIPKKEPKESKH